MEIVKCNRPVGDLVKFNRRKNLRQTQVWLLKQINETYPHLLLNVGDIEKRLDLKPQLPPGPCAELEVFAQVALDNLQRQPAQQKN